MVPNLAFWATSARIRKQNYKPFGPSFSKQAKYPQAMNLSMAARRRISVQLNPRDGCRSLAAHRATSPKKPSQPRIHYITETLWDTLEKLGLVWLNQTQSRRPSRRSHPLSFVGEYLILSNTTTPIPYFCVSSGLANGTSLSHLQCWWKQSFGVSRKCM